MKLVSRNNCPICETTTISSIYKLPYQDLKIKNFLKIYYKNRLPLNLLNGYDYDLLECNNCKFIFQKFIPDVNFAEELYEKYISAEESLEKKISNIENLKKQYHNEINLIKKIFNNKEINILEFGAGWGFWSAEAKKFGFNVSCFELSKKRVDYMKSRDLKVINGIENDSEKYDLIYSDQTFEHINNPKETLDLLNRSLNTNGYIYLNFPSSFGFKKKVSKNYTPKKDEAHPLEHLNLYNRSSMKFLIKDTNLEIINFRSLNTFNLRYLYKDIKNLVYFDSVLIKKIN